MIYACTTGKTGVAAVLEALMIEEISEFDSAAELNADLIELRDLAPATPVPTAPCGHRGIAFGSGGVGCTACGRWKRPALTWVQACLAAEARARAGRR